VNVPFPFTAIVAQDELTLALLLNAVDPGIGGVLVRGHKGTAKSTAVRGLASLMPPVSAIADCPYACDPAAPDVHCPAAPHSDTAGTTRPARLVELPVGATEDRVAGSLDLERALTEGAQAFEPGLLARANRGILYVDEVNLLHDHLVDLLLDAAAMGRNHVERESVSVQHAARFLLVGTMNPEEGELRPQLLDRFGLTVEVRAPRDPVARAEVVRRRLAYERDPERFASRFAAEEAALALRIREARARVVDVHLSDQLLTRTVGVCAALEVDGLRADIVIARTAAAVAAWHGRTDVELDDVRTACLLALPHRRRRGPFEEPGLDPEELDRLLHDEPDPDPQGPDGNGPTDRSAAGGSDRHPEVSGPPSVRDGAADGGGEPAPSRARDEELGGTQDARDDGSHGTDATPDGPEADGPMSDGAGAPGQVHAVGDPRLPPLLTVPGVGAGAWGRRSPARSGHGATVGARPSRRDERTTVEALAVGATLRAAAPHQRRRGRTGTGLILRPEDLRRRIRQGREGNLIVFVVDASGSMGARARMTAVKGAVRSLLLDAYQRRDKVALITFRGDDAQVVLPPTASTDVADRRLADLAVGGRTPLAAGLQRAGTLLRVEQARDPHRRPLVVVLTDGRANAGPDAVAASRRAGRALTAAGVASVVIDTEDGFVRMGLAAALAAAMAVPCVELEELGSGPLAGVVRQLTPRGRAA
jgi:magnesium chelatase subunit D